jgi:hypothetical protein
MMTYVQSLARRDFAVVVAVKEQILSVSRWLHIIKSRLLPIAENGGFPRRAVHMSSAYILEETKILGGKPMDHKCLRVLLGENKKTSFQCEH